MSVRTLIVVVAMASACSRPSEPTAEPSAAADAPRAVAEEGSAEEAEEPEAEGSADADTPAPPPLERLMRDLGYDDPSEAQLADFVPVPPGATGEAGVFGRGDETLRVALFRYPNPRFAGPHVRDLEERRALLPDGGEAFVARGPYVIHVEAIDRARADEAAAEIRARLRW